MPLMRDAETGVVREVSEAYLRRWPSDYLPLDSPDDSPAVPGETPAPTGEEQVPDRVLVKRTGGRKKGTSI